MQCVCVCDICSGLIYKSCGDILLFVVNGFNINSDYNSTLTSMLDVVSSKIRQNKTY